MHFFLGRILDYDDTEVGMEVVRTSDGVSPLASILLDMWEELA